MMLIGWLPSLAHDFEVEGVFYKKTSDNAVAVTYKGYSYDSYSNEYTGDVVIPSSVDYNGATYSVTSIGYEAFYNCSSLTSIEIPNSVTSIGDDAFYGCSSLTSIEIPNSVTSIGGWAFYHCTSLTSIEIPNSVTSIGNYAFCGCSSLTSIQIPNSITRIGDGAFNNCSSLTSIEIPNSVTSIGACAFYGCSGLTSIEIPNSVTSIGNDAFYYCSNLTKITCLATNPPTIGSDTFSNYSAELYVPVGCKSAYQSANYWKNFSNIIEIPEEISFGLVGHTSAISCNPQDDYSFGISWREFAEILYNDYIPFSSVEDFKNVYDTSNIKVIYSYNGRDITQYVGASFDASLNPVNTYAWSFTFYDNIPAEVFPLNVNDATNLDIQVLCIPKQDKESYPILRVNTNLTIEPLGKSLSKMAPKTSSIKEGYWKNNTTLCVFPLQYGSLDAGMTCDYRFPILDAFMSKPAVCNDKLDCVTWDVVFSNQQSAGYGAANYDLYFNNQIGAQLEWNSSSGIHTRFDELCGAASNHEVFVSVYNNAAGKEIINANKPVQITFLSRYPNGQVIPVESYNLEFIKPLNIRPFEFYDSFKDGDIVGEEGSIIDISNYEFEIMDYNGERVDKLHYAYYGLEEVVWHVEEARVGITSDGVVLSKDKMLTIDGEINTAVTTIIGQAIAADMSLVHNGSQLIYKNTGALNVEKDFYIALYVSVKHKWGEFKAPVIIPVKVVRNINNITLDKSEAHLIVDEQITLVATVLPENATNKSVTWKSSNEVVATVDANGKVTAVSIGEAIITAMTNDGSNLSASCKVIVHANYLSGKTVNTYSGASERVSVEMTNEQAITAFQCDIYLPDGISIATIDGEYDINLSSRAKSSHSLSCVEQSDGSIRLLCYSMSLATFSGNEGELFDINFNISKEIEGNYQVLINNVVLTDKAQNEYKSSAAIIDFNVKAYVPADVNNDGSINVTDVVATASYILGLDTKKFIFEAADMNKDGVINVTDIVGIASIILNGSSASNVSALRCAPNSYDSIKIEEFATGKNQSQQVAIEMTNASDYSACQMDIRLPKGMSIAECELASSATDHMVAYRELPDGAVRVLVYSLTCRTLPDSQEGIIRLRTTTDSRFEGGEIVVENILFADRGQNEYRLYDSVANVKTGVSATDMDCVVYAENRSIVIISPCDQQATITSVDGLSRTYTLNEGRNEIKDCKRGIYIIETLNRINKLIIK